MDSEESVNLADTVAETDYCLTSGDLLSLTSPEDNSELLLKATRDDSRIIYVRDGNQNNEEYFLSKKALHRWYVALNIRLAKARQCKLDQGQLTRLMSSLRVTGVWSTPPHEYVEFGKSSHMMICMPDGTKYGFPLASLIANFNSANLEYAHCFLRDYSYDEVPSIPPAQILIQGIENFLGCLTVREKYIISRRVGILGQNEMTLEEIGNSLDITRERVRQIEEKCWRKLRHRTRTRTLVEPFISYILERNLSLLGNQREIMREIGFIGRFLGFPISQILRTDLFIIATMDKEATITDDIWKIADDPSKVGDIFQSRFNLSLIPSDIKDIGDAICFSLKKQMTKSQKAYLALRSIGKPSHFSEIADAYQNMFPEAYHSEHALHAILLRETNGIIWIGSKGVFALEEWGYERPSMGIFEAIAEIVGLQYEKTKRPVALVQIQAEIGKYRKLINLNSVVMATYFNPRVKVLPNSTFIPASDVSDSEDLPDARLDEILRDFEKTAREGYNNRKETTQMEIVLVKEKETPGTWRFKENKEDHPMTIYLTKEQVKELGNPKSIKVTITAA